MSANIGVPANFLANILLCFWEIYKNIGPEKVFNSRQILICGNFTLAKTDYKMKE